MVRVFARVINDDYANCGYNVIGIIPTFIGSLTGISHLDLHNNQLAGMRLVKCSVRKFIVFALGTIPSGIGSLMKLMFLHFGSNQLSSNSK